MNNGKGVTVILTVWKRNHLEEQLKALLSQTQPPVVVWVQQTESHVDVDDVVKRYADRIQYSHYEENKGVFGRFESVREVKTDYVFIIDDDIIPGVRFLEVALRTSEEKNAIVSPNGRIIDLETNLTSAYVGDGDEFEHSFCTANTLVDFGNNAWLFKTEWIDAFLQYPPLYRNNGEDIHLSASLKLQKGIDTYVPKQWIPHEAGNTKRCYSADEHALHRRQSFQKERTEVVTRFRDDGWVLQKELPALTPPAESPLISVVMFCPATNEHTRQSIQSIIRQSFPRFELIIVCNDADHELANLLKDLKDSRARLIDTYEPIDKYAGLNIACGLAPGRYICLMGSDCIAVSGRLKLQYEYMEQHPEVVASGALCKSAHDGVSLEDDLIEETLIMRNEVLRRMKYFKPMKETDVFDATMLRLSSCGDITNIPTWFVETDSFID